MAAVIDRLLASGPVELRDADTAWRGTRAPGDDLSDLPSAVATRITEHWRQDVGGGQTRAQKWHADNPIALPEPAPRRLVAKLTIVERLIAAGKIEGMRTALNAQPVAARELWNARTAIYADDEAMLALLRSIGADPNVILA